MTVMQAKARTAETYIAGLGASGALMGGAIVAFVLLVGIVSFNAWPEASGLFTFSGGQAEVELQTPARTPAEGARAAPTALTTVIAPGGSATSPGGANGGQPGADGGQTEVTPPESPGGGGGAPVTQPTPPEAPTQTAGTLVSNLGNTLQQDSAALGDTLNQATGTNLGNAVTGLGQTLNSTLQGLTGANQ
jgi:hypothetical protein